MSVIVCTLAEVMQRHRITPRELAEVTGLSPAVIGALAWNRRMRVDLTQLAALLDVLANQSFGIGDLLCRTHECISRAFLRRAGRSTVFSLHVHPQDRALG